MLETLDIFKMQEDGKYVWKAAAETFEVATSKIEKLATTSPGEYMIFSQTTGKKTVIPLDATFAEVTLAEVTSEFPGSRSPRQMPDTRR
jgi:hypothetical protein